MRWDQLFADIDSQFDAHAGAEIAAEIADRTRSEFGRVHLAQRFAASVGAALVVAVAAGRDGPGHLGGTLREVGPDWILLGTAPGEVLVATDHVSSVRGAAYAVGPASDRVGARFDLRLALRGIARDRSGVRVFLTDGSVHDGTLDRVGADHVDLAEHAPGEARRRGAVRDVSSLVLAAIVAVQRTTPDD